MTDKFSWTNFAQFADELNFDNMVVMFSKLLFLSSRNDKIQKLVSNEIIALLRHQKMVQLFNNEKKLFSGYRFNVSETQVIIKFKAF